MVGRPVDGSMLNELNLYIRRQATRPARYRPQAAETPHPAHDRLYCWPTPDVPAEFQADLAALDRLDDDALWRIAADHKAAGDALVAVEV